MYFGNIHKTLRRIKLNAHVVNLSIDFKSLEFDKVWQIVIESKKPIQSFKKK